MTAWFVDNYIEIVGALLSLIYLFLSIKQKIWLWPVGLLSAVFYVIVFYQSKFYADMSLNVYYFFISIYGWLTWSGAKSRKNIVLHVRRARSKERVILVLLIIAIFGLLGYFLDNYTDSPIPYWDAFTTSGSIIATWMLAKKIIEHWIIWVVVDLVSLGLYIEKGLYPTASLFAVYAIMAIFGYLSWKRIIKTSLSIIMVFLFLNSPVNMY
jgi:nicotinamide mononucleotide transporter